MVKQPYGTVTLVFTDVEGSTRLLRELGRESYQRALVAHRQIVRDAFGGRCGYEVDYDGDGFFYAFQSAGDALAAVELALGKLESGPIRLRVGIHTGEPSLDPPKYIGLDVHLAARVMAAGHGGQVLLTRATRELVETDCKELGRHRLKDIPQAVFLYQLGECQFPPVRGLPYSTLPLPTTTFIGRQPELKQLRELLARDDVRLVTVTGPSGTGKTRCALEVGRLSEQECEVIFVDLSAATRTDVPLEALAAALGVQEQPGVELLDSVSTALMARMPLVILDNCEHLVAAVASLVEALLARTRGVRVLATSREPLHVGGEHRVHVPPLPFAELDDPRPERADAVQLFLERIRMMAPAFAANAATVAAAAEVVRRLDGLPLAIELAAARAALLGVSEVRDHLDERFRLLKTGPLASGRHHSLEAAIDWSYELLSAPAQAAFRTLSVFPTSFSLAAAKELTGPDALELVPALADASLLMMEDTRTSSYRYRLLESLRAYARNKLDGHRETNEANQRLTRWALATAEEAAATLDTREEEHGLAQLDLEGDNCAAPLAWALTANPPAALRLAIALSRWRTRRGRHRENADALTRTLEANPTAQPNDRARALLALSWAANALGQFQHAEEVAREAAELFRGVDELHHSVDALCRVSAALRNQGRLDDGAAVAREALELARAVGDQSCIADALREIGFVRLYDGDFSRARNLANEALEITQDALSPVARTGLIELAAVSATLLGEFDEAGAACEEGIATTTDEQAAHWLKGMLAEIRFRQGRTVEAAELGRESLEFAFSAGFLTDIMNALSQLATFAARMRRAETAAILIGAYERVCPTWRELPMDALFQTDTVEPTQTALGVDAYAKAVARGRDMHVDQLLELARGLLNQLRAEGDEVEFAR